MFRLQAIQNGENIIARCQNLSQIQKGDRSDHIFTSHNDLKMTTDSTDDTFDTDSLLERTRKYIGNELMSVAPPDRSSVTDDRIYLLRAINALISTNKEIWERCADSRDVNADGLFCFSRVSVHTVQCQTIDDDSAISVKVHPQISCKDFHELPPIPSILLELVPAHFPAPH